MGFEGPTPGLRGSHAEASASSREPRQWVSRAAGPMVKGGPAQAYPLCARKQHISTARGFVLSPTNEHVKGPQILV